jgi:hypothetical protein
LVFDSWIVDASIARTEFVWVLFFVVCVFAVFSNDGAALFRSLTGVGGAVLLFLLSVCLASCEGHMVDALASRADEGRWSLR